MTNKELLQLIQQAAKERATKLDLRNESLTALPSEISQLTNLTELDLRDNRFTKVPSVIFQLPQLTIVILRFNRLISLPPEISQLNNLMELDLRSNLLTTLPPEIGELSNLTSLLLGFNQLTTLPSEIGQLINLTGLDLRYNRLKRLPPQIGQLPSLTELFLNSNGLTLLPPEIGQLTNLVGFYLGENQLNRLPPSIGQLNEIQILDLSRNVLTALPSTINQLIKLAWLDLSGNPISIPPEILQKRNEPATVINYYFQHQANQRQPLNEAKLLLVGQGSVGKTSLVRQLVMEQFDLYETKTEGINIKQWFITVNNQQIRLNVWDFGGQEIMHATHQFFLTKRSLYLLVLDARLSEEQNRLDYWLKMIQSFGGESPVVVVGNKIDQQPLDLDKRGLMLKYSQIRAIIETSCLDGRGLAELQAAIEREIASLPHLNDQLLQSWFNVKTQLEGMDRDFVPYHEYVHMCQAEGVGDDLSQRTLIGFLHDLGVVLNFQGDPRLEELSILNPEWVTGGVYKILSDEALLSEHHGVLERTMLTRILDPARYPRDKHLFIVDMIRKFELCFDFEGFADRKFLIPDLLPKEEPDTGDWSDTLAFQYHYSILPGSITSRFIVRMNHLIHRYTYWRNGVVLAHEGNMALIKADREDKKIFIWVGGPEAGRRRFLSVIRTEFAAIHSTIPGLEVAEKVPLPRHPEIVVDYQHLRDLEEMGEGYFVPLGLRKRVSVKKVLGEIESEQIRRGWQKGHRREAEPILLRQDEIKRLIIGYQRRLQKLKEQEASTGRLTDPAVLIEIEDLEEAIDKLQMELKEIE